METFHEAMMEEAANADRGGALGLSGHYGVYAGIVFIHETCQFEAWLFGVNKQVQKQYWQLIKDSGWNQCDPGSFINKKLPEVDPAGTDYDCGSLTSCGLTVSKR